MGIPELVGGPTLRLPLRHFKISFNPGDMQRLGHYGSVYLVVMVGAPWGRIVVSHGDALIDASFSALTVAKPSTLGGRTVHGTGRRGSLRCEVPRRHHRSGPGERPSSPFPRAAPRAR